MRARTRVSLLFCVWGSTLSAAALATAADEPDPEPAIHETVTVTASRLATEPEPADRVPASVTTIDREAIERSGVRTVQDLLALEPGVVLYDEVGNDVEKTFDLRGFSSGSGTKVFLDGAPINDTRNNAVALDLIPPQALDRIEVSRGSAAALAGGGSEAGVIHLLTRHGAGLGGSLALAGGTFGAGSYAGEAHGGWERFDFFLSGATYDTDGFRENAGGDVTRAAATLGFGIGRGRRLSLSLVDTTSDLGNPGALTAGELAANRRAAPWNTLDRSQQGFRQAALNFRGALAGDWSLAANAFVRDLASEILSTGRSAALFGGFFLDSDGSAAGSTVQVTHDHRLGRATNRLILGVEWLAGDTDAAGFFTSPADPGAVDRSSPASDNTTERRTSGFYVQELWSPRPSWTILAGVRSDRDRVRYRDGFDPALDDSRSFSEVSLRAGVHWQATERHGVWVSYGEGFLPPTAEELFSFPLFFSNPDLDPEDSRSWEVGWRARYRTAAALDLTFFEVDTDDEIVFVPDPPPAFFTGANENVGRTRRRGVEAAYRGRSGERFGWFANLTLVHAEFRAGASAGQDVPLVPGGRLAVGFDVELPAAVALRLEALGVGRQVVDNDPENAQAKLDGYVVANARVTWQPAPWKPGPGRQGLRLWLETRNLLDERYASRAIFAGETFFTPAPGRRYLAGATWLF